MKKKLSFLLLLCMVFVLVGCSSKNSAYVGKWTGSHCIYNNNTITFEQVGVDMDMEIKDDGSIIVTTAGQSGSGTWSVSGDTITISSEGESLTGRMENDMIVITETETGMLMYFAKQTA